MKLIIQQKFQKKIVKKLDYPFEISSYGLYTIFVSARCRSAQQRKSSDDEDLRIEIDTRKFREMPPQDKPQYLNIPPAWNGSKLKNLKQTVIFLIALNPGQHTISLIPDESATLEEIKVYKIDQPEKEIEFILNEQAEDGDKRPWYTFVLTDLSLRQIKAEVTTQYRWWDSDDVKIIIDGKIQEQPKAILHRFWYWAGILAQKLLNQKITTQSAFHSDLFKGIHYIEFWADKTPILHTVELDLGPTEIKRIPTVDNPEWTGDLRDDPREILLARVVYGEAGGVSKLAKISVAWSIRNRVEDSLHRWGNNYHDVILQENQYDSLWNKKTYRKVRIPALENELEKRAWQDSYEIAEQVINNEIKDPTKGANHFYSISISRPDWAPVWTDEKKITLSVDNLKFYKL